MLRTSFVAMAVLLGLAMTAGQAQAWGAFRAGRTSFGYGGGVYHSSAGAYRTPYGGGYHAGTTGYSASTGFYHTGTTSMAGPYGGASMSSAYHSPYYGGAYGGGFRSTSVYGAGGGYSAGVYRVPGYTYYPY